MARDARKVAFRERFNPDQLRAVALAYRAKVGEGAPAGEAQQAATAAYLSHGGDPAVAPSETAWMVATVIAQHSKWFWRPARRYHEREEAALRHIGQWPGPLAAEDRRRLAEPAMVKMDAARITRLPA